MTTSIQDRLATLIGAHAYFTGVEIVTEKAGDVDAAIEKALGRLGFTVEIASASGDNTAADTARTLVNFREITRISVIHNPTLNEAKNIVEGWESVVKAVHGQPLVANGKGPNWFAVISHEAVPNPDGYAEHTVIVRINSQLTPAYTPA